MSSKYKAILAALESGLAGISTAAGYNTDVARVYRTPQNVMNIPRLPALILGDGDEEPEPETNATYRSTLRLPLVGVVASDTDVKHEGLASDAVHDLLQDVKNWLDANQGLGLSYVDWAYLKEIGVYTAGNRAFFNSVVEVQYWYTRGNA